MSDKTDILNFIDGEPLAPLGGQYLDNVDPATGAVYGRLPASDSRDIELAVAAAKSAFPAWSGLAAAQRSEWLLKIADRIEADLEAFARAESVDSGKPISLARNVEIPRAVANFRFFATAILHGHQESHPMDRQALNYTSRSPRGVAGLISPWNLPLYLLSWKIAPAIASGNTAVAKPSELTPMTAELLARACREIGLPSGVLNIVHGLGLDAGVPLTTHPDVAAISFTGGTETGAAIAAATARQFKKLSLEMGGKNPNVIFADADIDKALTETLRASFSNQGQICLCGSRILVERTIYPRFLEQLVERAAKLKQGDPLEPETTQGAVVSKSHYEKILSYLALAREEGGSIELGGRAATGLPDRCRDGYFIQPTIISGLGDHCRTNQEEIFGPVVTVQPFDDEREAIAKANSTRYGLAATVWTRDLHRAHRVAAAIDAGTVWVNCWLLRDLRVPFGGMKQSGLGREGGDEALRFFTEPKNICIKFEELEG